MLSLQNCIGQNSYIISMYHRRQFTNNQKTGGRNAEQNAPQNRTKSKFATLAPYIAEIQRRKKIKEKSKRSKKNLNQSSSKSFRIKDRSVTSLHKDIFVKNKETINTTLDSKVLIEQPGKERKSKSVQRTHEFAFSKTIHNDQKSDHNFFNDLYVRVKNKVERQKKPYKRKTFQTIQEHRARSQQAGEMNMYKIGFTNVTHVDIKLDKQQKQQNLSNQKKTEEIKNKKPHFRRGKFEAIHSSVSSAVQQPKKYQFQNSKSENRIELDKKQSNVSINKEMDILAEKQMENFYHQIRNKEIQRSIEKSTEKYFKYQSYRPVKSKNEIQVYVSTVTNPSFQKALRSTNDKSNNFKEQSSITNQKLTNFLDYDFDFKNQEQEMFRKIKEIDNPSQEQSSNFLGNEEVSGFEAQRRKVQIQFFHRETPRLDWSEDQCKIDQI